MIEGVLRPMPLALVGMWAAIGVVAAVIVVRLRNGDFGLRVGAALFAIGGLALVLLCVSVRSSPPSCRDVVEVGAEARR